MSLTNISTPYDTFTDASGKIIGSGTVYIGEKGEDPQSNPIPVYWDAEGTIPALQPLNIINGYIYNGGSPAQVFSDSDYSIRVYSQSTEVYYYPNILAKSISGTAGGDLAGSYPNPSIAPNAVTNSKIADKAVQNSKINPGANNTVKGTVSSNIADLTAYQLNGILGRVGASEFFTHPNFDPNLYYWMDGSSIPIVGNERLHDAVLALIDTQGSKGWRSGDDADHFKLPDRRGAGIRGYDPTNIVDPATRVLGSYQQDASQRITGTLGNIIRYEAESYTATGVFSNPQDASTFHPGTDNGVFRQATVTFDNNTSVGARTSTETRMANFNDYWCVVR